MPKDSKTRILKKADKIFDRDKRTVIEVSLVEYEFDGKKYPKLNIATWKQDFDGFPLARKKTINLPPELIEQLSKAFISLK